MIDFSKMWIEGSSPMFHHQSISAELVVLQSLPEVQSIMQTAQLSYKPHLAFYRGQVGAVSAGPGNSDNQFWIFQT